MRLYTSLASRTLSVLKVVPSINSFPNFCSQSESGGQRTAASASSGHHENQQQLITEEEEGNLENRRVAVIVCV